MRDALRKMHIISLPGLAALVVVAVIIGVALGTMPHGSAGAAAPKAAMGATLSYVQQEAEDATTNGKIIGPDFTFTHLASEASGRQAVTLSGQGKYVEFTLTQPANALTLRYSIPDAANGTGLTAPLSLYLNGTYKQDLSLTSKYSWFYGSYPFTNIPSNGTAHHFYDEVRVMFGSVLPAGAKVKVQVDAKDTAPSYTIDLADFYNVAAPLTQPAGSLSVASYGADATGARDSTQDIQTAVKAAEAQSKVLWIPSGTYQVNAHIMVNKVTLRGAGPWYTTLIGTGVGIYGNAAPNPSQNVQLYDFSIYGQVMNRDDKAQLSGIGGAMGGGSIIQDIWIEHTKVGMWFDGPFDKLTISNCTIRDTTADGINFHDGITDAVVKQTEIRNTGDDGLAMWSDVHADANDVFDHDTVALPILANNFAIYGGSNNSITNNLGTDTVTQGGGIQVANRFGAVPLAGKTTVTGNTLIRAGVLDPNWHFGVGAIWFYGSDGAMSGTVTVSENEIDDSPYEAIQFIGSSITHLTFNDDRIATAGTFAVQDQASGSATFSNVTASNLGSGGISDCGAGFTITQGSGNAGWSDAHCASLTALPGLKMTPVPAKPTPVPTQPARTPTSVASTPTTAATKPTLVTAIDAGGNVSGNFLADAYYDKGAEYSDDSTSIDTSGVTNPAAQAIYQSCRWSSAFTYTIPGLASGKAYTVQLDWAELTFQAAGKRKFNVAINGSQVLSSFDVYATAGYKKALAKQFGATANSRGQIVIAFTQGGADNPFINAIEIWDPSGSAKAMVPPDARLVQAIDAGGIGNTTFVADTDYNQGNEYLDVSSSIDTQGELKSVPEAVYQTCRWDSAFTYTLTGLTAGKAYTVQLDWAELTYQAAGQREFDVAINGSQALTNLDVYATVGYKHALQKQFTATANSSGQIVIAFTQGAVDNPFISGIEIYSAS